MTDDVARLFAEFEQLGEEEVRRRIAARTPYTSRLELDSAYEWLRQKDQARSDDDARRRDASQSEQLEIARSAKDAAWAAASAARDAAKEAREHAREAREQSRIARAANTRATIALMIAAISAAVLIIDIILRN